MNSEQLQTMILDYILEMIGIVKSSSKYSSQECLVLLRQTCDELLDNFNNFSQSQDEALEISLMKLKVCLSSNVIDEDSIIYISNDIGLKAIDQLSE
ncbi:MAG: hypothetical protein J6P61_09860 [Erysipelotrichaceae bacterium]|nr:hypothetical protein [Erysipelotrichaceae bacterium]